MTADTLQYVELNVWSHDACQAAFQNYGLNYDPMMICAYDEVNSNEVSC